MGVLDLSRCTSSGRNPPSASAWLVRTVSSQYQHTLKP